MGKEAAVRRGREHAITCINSSAAGEFAHGCRARFVERSLEQAVRGTARGLGGMPNLPIADA